MGKTENPLTEHDAEFLNDCIEAIQNHPAENAVGAAYNLALMFHHAMLSIAQQCSDGRDAGLLMLGCVIDEAKQDAIKQILAENETEEDNNETTH